MDCLHGGKHLRLQLIGFLQLPNRMITHLLALLIGFVAGALVFRKHAGKASELEAKGRQALDALKGK